MRIQGPKTPQAPRAVQTQAKPQKATRAQAATIQDGFDSSSSPSDDQQIADFQKWLNDPAQRQAKNSYGTKVNVPDDTYKRISSDELNQLKGLSGLALTDKIDSLKKSHGSSVQGAQSQNDWFLSMLQQAMDKIRESIKESNEEAANSGNNS